MADPVPVPPAQAGPAVVTLPAEIDLTNADIVRGQLDAACAAAALVVADMTATRFCDTSGIRAVVVAYQEAAAHGTELRLLRPSPRVMQVIKILALDTVLPIYQSLEEASARLGPEDADSQGTP